VVAHARRALGSRVRRDRRRPAAFIARAYQAAGWRLPELSRQASPGALHALARRLGRVRPPRRPLPGDLAFFDSTRDANGNGRVDDGLTHVALVEGVDADGTVRMFHLRHGRVERLVAHPAFPHASRRKGKRINSYLRRVRRGEGRRTPHLAGEMLVGFATLIR